MLNFKTWFHFSNFLPPTLNKTFKNIELSSLANDIAPLVAMNAESQRLVQVQPPSSDPAHTHSLFKNSRR